MASPALPEVLAVEAVAGGQHSDRLGQDAQVEPEGPMLDVPDVQLDPLGPSQRGPAVDLRPSGDAGLDGEPPALALGVAVDLLLDGRAGADECHLAADDVDQVRELVEREAAQDPAYARDPGVALDDVDARAHGLGAAHHRAQLE